MRKLLADETADAKFDSAVQIVISFLIGAIILGVLLTVFGTTISNWLTTTVGSWFSAGGVVRPSASIFILSTRWRI